MQQNAIRRKNEGLYQFCTPKIKARCEFMCVINQISHIFRLFTNSMLSFLSPNQRHPCTKKQVYFQQNATEEIRANYQDDLSLGDNSVADVRHWVTACRQTNNNKM